MACIGAHTADPAVDYELDTNNAGKKTSPDDLEIVYSVLNSYTVVYSINSIVFCIKLEKSCHDNTLFYWNIL